MKCVTEDCINEARPGRKLCNTCRTQKYRAKYPLKYIYTALKTNAKRRRKLFTLTFDEFECFCRRTGYHELKGQTPTSMTIDRIKNELGYTADNIQAITLHDNVLKEFDNSVKPVDTCPF
jgi:hypothetical protein